MSLLNYVQKPFQDHGNAIIIRSFFRMVAIALAGIHTWAAITSQSMNADGISYLDIGDAYFRGDWAIAINPVWPPLYSWILGLVNFVFKPSMEWEFPIIHILNFVIFLGAMACFEFMWQKLRKASSSNDQAGILSLPVWAWWSIGYCLFIWTSLSLIQIWAVTPDLLMAALVYLAAGLLIDIRTDSRRWSPFIYLGIVLGLGYLAKTFMLSIALVFLALCLVLIKWNWSSVAKLIVATGIFLLFSLPFIMLISNKAGELTIGKAGTVTYLRYVHGIPFPHWQGDLDNQVVLDHPSRQINSSPPIYEFGEPIGGTYPISTDPSYWFEGISLPFNPANQLARLFVSTLFYLELFFKQQGFIFACTAALYWMGCRQRTSFLEIIQKWVLVIPAVVAFGLYGLVLVAGRYIGVFILLFWAGILSNIQVADMPNNRSWIKVMSALVVIGLLMNIMLFNLDGFTRLNPSIEANIGEQSKLPKPSPVEVAKMLQQLGIQEGDKVAIIGYGFDSFWARLARVRIVAEMLETQASDFWQGDDAFQKSVLQTFASTGAKAVVAEYVPSDVVLKDWRQVGNSSYYIYKFEE
jgi:hypothetical protein